MYSATTKNILRDRVFHHRQLKHKFNTLNSDTQLRPKCQISENQRIKCRLSKFRKHVINKQTDKESDERLRANDKEAIFIEFFHKNP
jgi:hypothetical protein